MKTPIATTAEIKQLLKINHTNDDALIDVLNDMATEMLCSHLGVDQIVKTAYTGQCIKPVLNYDRVHGSFLPFPNFPVDVSTITLKDDHFNDIATQPDSFFVFDDIGRNVRAKNADGSAFLYGREEYIVDYTAGYIQTATIDLTANATAGQKFKATITGTQTEYEMVTGSPSGNQIQIGGTQNDTAANIAAKLGGTVNGDNAIIVGAEIENVDLPATITNPTLPKQFKMAIALLVNGGLAEQEKAKGIQSYSIKGKSVTFRSDTDQNLYDNIIKKFAHKAVRITA